jgi:hypothetical protein
MLLVPVDFEKNEKKSGFHGAAAAQLRAAFLQFDVNSMITDPCRWTTKAYQ